MSRNRIDLSLENVMKTILYYDEKLLVKDYTPTYKMIEHIENFEEGRIKDLLLGGVVPWKEFKKKYGNRRILSVHDYDDTRTTSICLERVK